MATAAWVDLVVDEELFGFSGRMLPIGWGGRRRGGEIRQGRRSTRGRDRRGMFIVALVIGGFLGAVLYRFGGSKAAIAVSGAGKGAVVVGYWFHEERWEMRKRERCDDARRDGGSR